ncbi:unnamed protein product [Bursaphelenchus okinawaensis]|uniref:MFS domain-containing protein n=1 Tax=Bursaphelenchus okinawaensis TaxID=465554 RepID=A0A811LP94_9BILA|nr:unnamed protein product [Bursaphelenchus okinawaensis]CAG9124851.1 unnamed protein product [Bursaphelenchus okinawaensis]
MSWSACTESSTITESEQHEQRIEKNKTVLIATNILIVLATSFHLGFKLIYADFIGEGDVFLATEDFNNLTDAELIKHHFTRFESPLYTNLACMFGAAIVVVWSKQFSQYSPRYCLIFAILASLVGAPFTAGCFIWKQHWMQTLGLCLSDIALVVAVCFQVCLVQDISNTKMKKKFTFFTGIAFALGTFAACCLCLCTFTYPSLRLFVYLALFSFILPAIIFIFKIPDPIFHLFEEDSNSCVMEILNDSNTLENTKLQEALEFYHNGKLTTEESKLIYTRSVAKCPYDGLLHVWIDRNGCTVAIIAIVTNMMGAVCDHLFSLRWYIHHVYKDNENLTIIFTLTFAFLLGTLLSIPISFVCSRRYVFLTASMLLFFCEVCHGLMHCTVFGEIFHPEHGSLIGMFFRILQTIASGATFSTHAWTIGAELAPRNIQLMITGAGIFVRFFFAELFTITHVAFREYETYALAPMICIVTALGITLISMYMPQGNGFFNMYSWWINIAEDAHAQTYFNKNKYKLYTNYNYNLDDLKSCKEKLTLAVDKNNKDEQQLSVLSSENKMS